LLAFLFGERKMTDMEFLTAFEECTLDNFHHIDHIRMAWLYLSEYGFEIGSERIVQSIRRLAASKNSQLYHETVTQFWIHLVQHGIEAAPGVRNFDSFLNQLPCLRNSHAIYHHYTHDLLMSESARSHWREPDLLSMPPTK
jgi:hypothetical protein